MKKVKVIFDIVPDEDDRWLVRLFQNVYGEYADQKQARLDALEAAADARQLGHDVEVRDCRPAKGCCDLQMNIRIAYTVQQLREEQGFSQAQLADRAGVTVNALRNVESGHTARPRTIERIARALGFTPMELYERAAAGRSRSTVS